jgi:uncharacterized Fe-S cluster-containing MiaB family protein
LISANVTIDIHWVLTLPIGVRGSHSLLEIRVMGGYFEHISDEVTGNWRKLHSKLPRKLHPTQIIIRVIKTRGIKWTRQSTCMGCKRIAQKVLVGKPEANRQLGRTRRELEHNIKKVLQHKVCESMGWVHLAQKSDK